MNLYPVKQEYKTKIQALSDINEPWAADTLEAVKGEAEEFISNCCAQWLNQETDIAALEAHIKTCQERLKDERAKQERFKFELARFMQETGIEKIESPLFKASFRKSSSVLIEDEQQIPPEYFNEKRSFVIDKTRIKEAIKNGREIPGAKIETHHNLQLK